MKSVKLFDQKGDLLFSVIHCKNGQYDMKLIKDLDGKIFVDVRADDGGKVYHKMMRRKCKSK